MVQAGLYGSGVYIDDWFGARNYHNPNYRGGKAIRWNHFRPRRSIFEILYCAITRRRAQGVSPKQGLSRLPYEIKSLIFQHLVGREVCASRLVCRAWEEASRPFFAQHYLERRLFWITAANLNRLEKTVQKFGPYMKSVYIVPVHFTMDGLIHALRTYLRFRQARDGGPGAGLHGYQDTRSAPPASHRWHPEVKREQAFLHDLRAQLYFGQWYRCIDSRRTKTRIYHDKAQAHRFLRSYAAGVVAQMWLRLWQQDGPRLAAVQRQLPHCALQVRRLDFSAPQMQRNREVLGMAAPEWSVELALFCPDQAWLYDVEYGEHVATIVAEAVAAFPLGFLKSSDHVNH